MTSPIATITLNPAIDQTASLPNFQAGAVNRVAWEQSDPGGKGVNVASFLSDFGYAVTVSGFLGKDNIALFEALFQHKNIQNQFVLLPGRTRTNVKIIDDLQDQVTDINFPGQSPTPADLTQLQAVIDQLAVSHDWFVLSGSLPAGVPSSIYAELTQQLKAQGKTVVLDASGASLQQAISCGPYAIKPNLQELREGLGQALTSMAEILAAARSLLGQGINTVVVSMGAEGAVFVEAAAAVLVRPSPVKVVSTVGAGDAMVAGLVTGKLRGLDLADSARLATAFSIGALSQLGPQLPPRAVVEAFTHQVEVETLN
jgi:1-phosphofructokinase